MFCFWEPSYLDSQQNTLNVLGFCSSICFKYFPFCQVSLKVQKEIESFEIIADDNRYSYSVLYKHNYLCIRLLDNDDVKDE